MPYLYIWDVKTVCIYLKLLFVYIIIALKPLSVSLCFSSKSVIKEMEGESLCGVQLVRNEEKADDGGGDKDESGDEDEDEDEEGVMVITMTLSG